MTARRHFFSIPFHSITLKIQIVAFFLVGLSACGSVVQLSPGGGNDSQDDAASASGNAADADSAVYVFATDYQSGGQLYAATTVGQTATLTSAGVESLGSSAIVRVDGGLVYVLHDGFSAVSSDNLQIIDPEDGYATLGQYSTGNGTNPHDVAISGDRAFITLYNPTADPDNVDDSGLPGDVIELDTTTGEIVNRFSFYNYLANDGDRNANADQMVLIDDTLYVALQDLDSDTFAASSNGLIGVIDLAQNRVTGAISLTGRNPVSMALSDDGTKLAVADMATYESGLGGFNTIRPYGGVEMVDVDARIPLGIVDDEDLGGYVERIESAGGVFYVIVSEFDAATFTYSSKIVAFSQDDVSLGGAVTIDDAGTDIREIAIDGDVFWISRRQTNANTGVSEPSIEAVDLATGTRIGDVLTPAAPGMSMVGR